jgi:phytoene dehydrogenase-like protein
MGDRSGATPDVIVVGGCHNGLACAIYMARVGLDVLVLERRPLVGGAAVTEESWPGYRVSTASYVVSLMPERVVAELASASGKGATSTRWSAFSR